MKTILALEASSDFASVALWRDGAVLAGQEFASKRSLSSDLFPVLARLLEGAGAVDRVVVGLGPGSYAGVRIAIAAALGLQCVWGCELVGIPSVAALGHFGETFQAIGDARRGTWYYSRILNGICVEGPLLLGSEQELHAALALGAELNAGPVRASEILPPEWQADTRPPQAAVLAQLAAQNLGIVQQDDLEPLYLREVHITLPGAVG